MRANVFFPDYTWLARPGDEVSGADAGACTFPGMSLLNVSEAETDFSPFHRTLQASRCAPAKLTLLCLYGYSVPHLTAFT